MNRRNTPEFDMQFIDATSDKIGAKTFIEGELYLNGENVLRRCIKAWIPTVPNVEVLGWVMLLVLDSTDQIILDPDGEPRIERRTGWVKWVKP